MRNRRAYSVMAAVVAAALFGGAFAKTPPQSPAPEADGPLRLYTEGVKELVINRDSAAARQAAQQVLRSDSTYGPALYLMARTGGSTGEQRRYARRAWQSDTTNKYYLELLGQLNIGDNRFAEAAECYERLLQSDDNPYNYRLLAMLYGQTGELGRAIALLDTAETKFGRLPALVAFRHRLYIVSRQFVQAEAEALRMVDETPYLPESHIALADTYMVTGRDSLAGASYRQAVAQDSLSAEAWSALRTFCQQQHDYSGWLDAEAHLFDCKETTLEYKLKTFEALAYDRRIMPSHFPQVDVLAGKIFTRHIDSAEACEFYARYMYATRRDEVALKIYRQMLDADPSAELYDKTIRMEVWCGHADEAARLAAQALTLWPDNVELHATLGDLEAMCDRHEEAIEKYRGALRIARNDTLRSRLWGSIGMEYERLGRRKECFKAYDKALRHWGDNAPVLNNYAYFLSLEGVRLDRALAMAERATAKESGNPTYLDTYAWVLYRLGRCEEAKRKMQQALSLDKSKSPELALHYGDILDALGETFVARTYWRKALELGHTDTEGIERRLRGDGAAAEKAGGDRKK